MESRIKYDSIIIFMLFSHIMLNILINAIPIIPNSLYYRCILLIQVVSAFLVCMNCKKWLFNKRDAILIVFIVVVQLLAYISVLIGEEYTCFDVHRLFIFIVMLCVCYFLPKNGYIKKENFEKILKLVVVFGIVATVYNFVNNWSVIETFDLKLIMHYTSSFSSFFSARSNYSLLLCFAFIICIYFKEKRQSLWYALLSMYFVGNILLTNARTSTIAIFIVMVYHIWVKYKKKKEKFIFCIIGVFVLFLIPWSELFSGISNFAKAYPLLFMHGNRGDFSNGRINLIKLAIDDMNIINIFTGHGIGSKDAYLMFLESEFLSFHNSWVDLFFEGGLFLCVVYIMITMDIIIRLKKSDVSSEHRYLFYGFILMIFIAGIGDAVALPFMLDSSVLLSSVLCYLLPVCFINSQGCSKIK